MGLSYSLKSRCGGSVDCDTTCQHEDRAQLPRPPAVQLRRTGGSAPGELGPRPPQEPQPARTGERHGREHEQWELDQNGSQQPTGQP
jgi:hypothetical protein